MPRIKTYDRLDSQTELGSNAELFVNSTCFVVGGLTVRELMVTYEPEILQAEVALLRDTEAGCWKWNRDRRKWERK